MADQPDDLYRTHGKVIEAVIRTVCREVRFRADEAEDFAQDVRLRLLDPLAAVLRKFAGRSSPYTYLYVVVKRWALDRRVQQWGRWRPYVATRKAGPAAVRLEILVVRDGVPLDQALAMVLREFPDEDAARLKKVADAFQPRTRRQAVEDAVLDSFESEAADPEQQLIEAEQEAGRGRSTRRLAEVISALPDDDRLLVLLRFEQGMTVADIARLWKVDQKGLYRRFDDLLRRVRKILKDEGFDVSLGPGSGLAGPSI